MRRLPALPSGLQAPPGAAHSQRWPLQAALTVPWAPLVAVAGVAVVPSADDEALDVHGRALVVLHPDVGPVAAQHLGKVAPGLHPGVRRQHSRVLHTTSCVSCSWLRLGPLCRCGVQERCRLPCCETAAGMPPCCSGPMLDSWGILQRSAQSSFAPGPGVRVLHCQRTAGLLAAAAPGLSGQSLGGCRCRGRSRTG